MEQTFVVRKAIEQDQPGILRCLAEAFESYRQQYTPDAFLDTVLTPATLEARFASMTIFVAVGPQGEVTGTIGYGT